MFTTANSMGYSEPSAGVHFKTLVHGEKTLMTEFRVNRGSAVPRHSHPHEQTGYLLSGHLSVTIGNQVFDARAGDSWCILGNIEHEAHVLEDSVVIEVFSPVREDLLPSRPTG